MSPENVIISFDGYENLTDDAADLIIRQVCEAIDKDEPIEIVALQPDPVYPIAMIRYKDNRTSMVQLHLR